MKSIKIAPSILSADFAKMGEEIARVQDSGADLIHCDIMDGYFVPNLSFGPKMIADIRKYTTLPLDVHLMVINPERYVAEFIKAGADFVTIHLEACQVVRETLEKIKSLNCKCGIVLNPLTDVNLAKEYLDICDLVLLMSVNPGFGGQKFILPVMEKIQTLRKLIDESGREILLEIDGGICEENYRQVIEKGADTIVAGSFLFNAKDMGRTIGEMKR